MTGGYRVLPLRCAHCGAELPVMGPIVAFRCASCGRYWLLGRNGLEAATVYRARAAGDEAEETLLLPFWAVEIDVPRLRALAGGAVAEAGVTAPAAAVERLLARIGEAGRWFVYVPAFHAPNPNACLALGRLFTRGQPAARIEKAGGGGRPVLCALRADEALALVDYVFLAHLPSAILENADLAGRLHAEPAAAPWLVEYPFVRRGHDLVSLAGGYVVPVALVAPPGTAAPAPIAASAGR